MINVRLYTIWPRVLKEYLEGEEAVDNKHPFLIHNAAADIWQEKTIAPPSVLEKDPEEYKRLFDALMEVLPKMDGEWISIDDDDLTNILAEGATYSELIKDPPILPYPSDIKCHIFEIEKTLFNLEHIAKTLVDRL